MREPWTTPSIARTLNDRHGLGLWHSQMVAVGYERARGIREKNQKCSGERSVSVSKTIDAGVEAVYALCAEEKRRAGWLGLTDAVVRKANENKNLRLSWGDGTSVELRLTPKAAGKTQIVADHEKLPDNQAVERMRAFWSGALGRLKDRRRSLSRVVATSSTQQTTPPAWSARAAVISAPPS